MMTINPHLATGGTAGYSLGGRWAWRCFIKYAGRFYPGRLWPRSLRTRWSNLTPRWRTFRAGPRFWTWVSIGASDGTARAFVVARFAKRLTVRFPLWLAIRFAWAIPIGSTARLCEAFAARSAFRAAL